MISSKNNVANAVGGKSARACDSCIRKRARWYCAADDAFLCQACDSSVHSANPLARRHERVRLKTASLKSLDLITKENSNLPSWHGGFTRKARTPRHCKPSVWSNASKHEETIRNTIPIVPEVGSDELSREENEEEQLLYRVPTFEPFVAKLCTSTTISNSPGNETDQTAGDANGTESKASLSVNCSHEGQSLNGFMPSDMDLAEFAANVESLFGRSFENESFGMEELGLVDCKEEKELNKEYSTENANNNGKVKLEAEEGVNVEDNDDIDMAREGNFELSFDYDSPSTCGEEDEKVVSGGRDLKKGSGDEGYDVGSGAKKKKRKILLNLDYDGVITAWASHGLSPWTSGNRPDFDPDECWPDFMGICGTELHHPFGDTSGLGGHPAAADGGREARVSRYREKRRTRLFSKKIRYEVRKLNAEKRPRMKGRFVKRATLAGPAIPLLK